MFIAFVGVVTFSGVTFSGSIAICYVCCDILVQCRDICDDRDFCRLFDL